MPNLRSADVTKDGISLVAANGKTFAATRQDILAFYQAQGGNPAARKAATVAWLKANIVAALGAEMVPEALINFDFDTADANKQILLELF